MYLHHHHHHHHHHHLVCNFVCTIIVGHERNICNYHIISAFPPAPKPVVKDRTPTPEVDEEGELRESKYTNVNSYPAGIEKD